MHIPVLLNEIIEQIESNKNYVDCTLGFGGHSKEILKKNGPNGKVLGIEIDKEIFEKTIKDERLIAVNDSYVNLEKIVEKHNFKDISGILLDAGMSSYHIDLSGRGFSFNKDEPLLMNYGSGISAEEIINEYSEDEIERILDQVGPPIYENQIINSAIQKIQSLLLTLRKQL